MFAPVNTCDNSRFPSFRPPPPPPPPPRRGNLDMREAPCTDTFVTQAASVRQPDRDVSTATTAGQSSRTNLSKQAKTSNQLPSSKSCSCCKQLSQLQGRLSKMEADTQAAMKTLAADLARLQRERETAWKHVGELQEQNRLMRQRQRDLEEQNSLLNRILQERNERAKPIPMAPQYPGDMRTRPPLVSLSLNNLTAAVGMPKVPHMGTDIW
ncbi:hypothetical protein VaNZ11_012334 [Volvox africanus]|uniref:BZIP domain-containing protein n=1 Tax=Volvox africanus TaxID=51714 RepID=A0ABQ5SDQ2_9CHLO|nr:hypothetical protein VaNZ11_012334 [Volvox africanus]